MEDISDNVNYLSMFSWPGLLSTSLFPSSVPSWLESSFLLSFIFFSNLSVSSSSPSEPEELLSSELESSLDVDSYLNEHQFIWNFRGIKMNAYTIGINPN